MAKVDLISDPLSFGRLWYDTPDNAIGYAMHSSRSHNAVIRVYDDAGNVIETGGRKGDFKAIVSIFFSIATLFLILAVTAKRGAAMCRRTGFAKPRPHT